MAKAYRFLMAASWWAGLLSMVAGVLLRLVPTLAEKTTFAARGGIILAGVLFLCVLATREMERAASSGS